MSEQEQPYMGAAYPHPKQPRGYEGFVKDGAAVLDQKVPGWYRKVDLETLDLEQPGMCIIGQLYGVGNGVNAGRYYMLGLVAVSGKSEQELVREDPDVWWARDHGFDTFGDHDELTRLWTEAIVDRIENERKIVCKRDQFMDDPMTIDTGMGGEMVGLIDCSCPNCEDEQEHQPTPRGAAWPA